MRVPLSQPLLCARVTVHHLFVSMRLPPFVSSCFPGDHCVFVCIFAPQPASETFIARKTLYHSLCLNVPPFADDHCVLVCICAYNEDQDELQRTLTSLYRQTQDMHEQGYEMSVMVIQDGWSIAHPTFKSYVSEMFAGYDESKEQVARRLTGLEGQTTTAVLQRVDPNTGKGWKESWGLTDTGGGAGGWGPGVGWGTDSRHLIDG